MNVGDAKADQVVARGEQEGGGQRKQQVARAPGFSRTAPGQGNDAGDDR